MNRIIVVVIFVSLLYSNGFSQNFSFEPRITIGGGYTSWKTKYPLSGGIQVDGKVYNEVKGTANGGNMSIQFSPIFKLKRFILGPNFGFQEYFVDKISFSPLNFELETSFKNTFKIGVLFGYDFNLSEKEGVLISPLFEVGVHTFKPSEELTNKDLFKNKFYGSLGVGLAKTFSNWKIKISPSYDIVICDVQFPNQEKNYLEVRVRSFNMNVGVGYIIDL